MKSILFFVIAAILEIAGCFAFWQWQREGKAIIWLVPGLIALAGFAYALTRVESAFAGRAFAAYGGIYIVSAIIWMALIERQRPDIWDIVGGAVCLAGTAIILFAPRG